MQNLLVTLSAYGASLFSQATPAEPVNPPGAMTMAPAPGPAADFQPYIFWAYGGACVLLLLFTLWTFLEARTVASRLRYLRGRFREAHPGESDED